jgi:hypothetical protein
MAENTFTLPSDQILDMWNINRQVGKDCFFFSFFSSSIFVYIIGGWELFQLYIVSLMGQYYVTNC